ncbi:MAG: tail fiber protein [Candidatus Melainabacteria bacterium]|nr:MAG: tail fiber protein [Candidatus Melainabacteria bacterium]
MVTYPINYTHEKCLPCDGFKLKISDYKQLYAVIGSRFNDGTEASDEFRIPDYNITGRFLQPGTNVGK